MTISKSLSLYERDSFGVLIAQETPLEVSEEDIKNYPELKDQTIKVIPMTRGELKVLFSLSGKKDDKVPETTRDEDGELILKYCKEPVFTKEELPYIKPVMTRSIVNTIFRESGIIIKKDGEKSIRENDSFSKNFQESGANDKKVA
jgi:hypothetical protein